jgi:hypothetical protein
MMINPTVGTTSAFALLPHCVALGLGTKRTDPLGLAFRGVFRGLPLNQRGVVRGAFWSKLSLTYKLLKETGMLNHNTIKQANPC